MTRTPMKFDLLFNPKGRVDRSTFIKANFILYVAISFVMASHLIVALLFKAGLSTLVMSSLIGMMLLSLYPYFCIYRKWFKTLNVSQYMFIGVALVFYGSLFLTGPFSQKALSVLPSLISANTTPVGFLLGLGICVAVPFISFSGIFLLGYLTSKLPTKNKLQAT